MGQRQSVSGPMGVRDSRFLRTLVLKHLRHRGRRVDNVVFKTFDVEPVDAHVARVSVTFVNGQGEVQKVAWLAKQVVEQDDSDRQQDDINDRIRYEIQVYKNLLQPLMVERLRSRSLPSSSSLSHFSSNVFKLPSLIMAEETRTKKGRRKSESSRSTGYLVLEDPLRSSPLFRPLSLQERSQGLRVSSMKSVLATLAQFHAAGLWLCRFRNLHTAFPFLKAKSLEIRADKESEKSALDVYERIVSEWNATHSESRDEKQRRLKLLKLLRSKSTLASMQDNLTVERGRSERNLLDKGHQMLCLGLPLPHELLMVRSMETDLAPLSEPMQPAMMTNAGRVHLGHPIHELAVFVFGLSSPKTRDPQRLIDLLQTYAQVFAVTSAVLDLDVDFQCVNTLAKMLTAFYSHVPCALREVIVTHTTRLSNAEIRRFTGVDKHKEEMDEQKRAFLVGLLDRVYNPIDL